MEGFVLNIPKEMLDNLDKADAALAKLGTTADTTKTKVINAFKDINRKGLQSFTDRLDNASKKLEELGKKKVTIQFDAPKNIMDNINNIINGVNQVHNVTNKKNQTNIIDVKEINQELGLISDLKKKIEDIDKLLNKGKDKDKNKLTASSQQALVNLRGRYQDELKIQQQTNESKIKKAQEEAEKLSKIDEQRYQKWLSNKDKEVRATTEAEDKKYKIMAQKAHQSFVDNEQKKAEIAENYEKNKQAKQQSLLAEEQYRETLKMYRQMFDEIDEEEKKANEKAIKETQRAEREKTRIREKENKERIANYKAQNKAANQTFEGAIKFSNNANTINREILAIKNLEAARNSLSKTDVNYKKKLDQLNSAILRHKVSIDNATSGAKNLQNAHKGLLNTSEQLTRKLALVFSISQIAGYANKLISVRGEFELQQRSLQAILKDKEQANKLFNQITQLAVQSPFQLKELVTYTKQLAAYRIETGKLYDTTKMLADISAGVGVDMSRLVLAYGQVSSANYLRGTELRQFSEAGINVLGGLADYFTELEGRVVGVDEVFDRVSKRMVLFEDVEKVLKKMTSEGGDFYHMQEIQSQTLKGQVSNLKDSIDIMMNEIGKDNDGTLKHLVGLIRNAVDNWRAFAAVLKMVGTTLMTISFVQFAKGLVATNAAMDVFIAKGNKVAIMGGNVQKGFLSLLTSIKTHPFIALATALGTVAFSIWEYNKAIDAANKVYDENSLSLDKSVKKLDKLEKQVNDVNKVITDANQVMKEQKSNTEAYSDAEVRAAMAMKENSTLLETLKSQYPSIYENIVQNTDGTLDLAAAVAEYNRQVEFSIGLEQNKKGGFLKKDSNESYQDAVNEKNDLQGEVTNAKYSLELRQRALEQAKKQGKIDEENFTKINDLLNELRDTHGLEEEYKMIKKIDQAMLNLGGKTGLSIRDIFDEGISHAYKAFAEMREYQIALKQIHKNLEDQASLVKGEWENRAFDQSTQEGQVAAKKWANKLLDDLGYVDDEIRKYAIKWMEQELNIKVNWNVEDPTKTGHMYGQQWVKAVEKPIAEAISGIPKLIQSEVVDELYTMGSKFTITPPQVSEEFDHYAKYIKTEYEARKELFDQAHTAGQKIFNEKDKEEIDQAYNAAKQVMKILGLLDEKPKGGGKNERMRGMIELIREMNREYTRLSKTLDATTAKQRILDSYADTFKRVFEGTGIKMEDVDFIDEEGVVASLQNLREIANGFGKEARTILEHNISQVEIDIELQLKKDQDKDLLGELNGMIDDYEMSLDLQANHITPDQARNLFGLDALTLPQLKDVAKQFESQIKGGEPTEEYKKVLKRIDELEEKQQQERLKKYLEYTRDAISERAKIKLEEMQKLEEIEDTFKPKKDATEEEVRAMEEAKMAAILGVQKEAREQMDKYDWTEFQKTDTFVSIFNDLENTSNLGLENMIQKLEEFKAQWTDMPLDQMKQVIELLDKLKAEQNERAGDANPFSRMRNLRTEISDNSAYGTTMPEIDANIAKDEEEIFSTQQELDLLDIEIQKTIELKDVKNDITVSDEAHLNSVNLRLKSLQNEKDKLQSIIKELEKDKELTEDQKKRLQEVAKLYSKQAKNLQDIQNMANSLYGAFKDLAEVLGADMESDAAIFADMGMNMANMVLSTIQMQTQIWGIKAALDIAGVSAKSFGYALNTAMGVIGWIVMAIQLIVEGIKAATKVHDNRLQKQIEKDAAAVEQLEKAYEKLEKKIEEAMSFQTYNATFDEMNDNIEDRIAHNNSMMSAEQDKKKSDAEAIKGWQEDNEKLREQQMENEKKRLEEMGGITNAKDAAEGFIDVWFDAYKETGDGLDALEGKWDDYFDNLLKKQMLMAVGERWVKQYIDRVNEMLEEDSEGGTKLTADELKELEDLKEKTSIEMNEVLKNLANSLGIEGGMPELEGLSKSIQGVTETTAQALEALLNSMRFYVIDTNSELKNLADDFRDFSLNSFDAVVNEMKSQTNLIDAIKNMIDDVMIPVQGGNGKALYVSM